MGIGEAVIHRGESGGAGVGEPGDLNRRGLAREREDAVAGHVHRKIDEDVDLILSN